MKPLPRHGLPIGRGVCLPVATEQRVRLTRGQTVAVVAGLGLLFVHTLVTVVQVTATVFPHSIAALVQALG